MNNNKPNYIYTKSSKRYEDKTKFVLTAEQAEQLIAAIQNTDPSNGVAFTLFHNEREGRFGKFTSTNIAVTANEAPKQRGSYSYAPKANGPSTEQKIQAFKNKTLNGK